MRRTPTVRTRFIIWALLLAAAAAFCSLAAASPALWSKAMAWTETTSPRLVSRPAAAVTRLLIWSVGTLTLLSRRTATDRRDTLGVAGVAQPLGTGGRQRVPGGVGHRDGVGSEAFDAAGHQVHDRPDLVGGELLARGLRPQQDGGAGLAGVVGEDVVGRDHEVHVG